MEFPTLYKQTATGAINRWTILVESNYYWTEFGKVDGVLQSSGTANTVNVEQELSLEYLIVNFFPSSI